MKTIDELKVIQKKYSNQILNLPGVSGFGMHGGVLTIYVSGNSSDGIPKELDGAPISIILNCSFEAY